MSPTISFYIGHHINCDTIYLWEDLDKAKTYQAELLSLVKTISTDYMVEMIARKTEKVWGEFMINCSFILVSKYNNFIHQCSSEQYFDVNSRGMMEEHSIYSINELELVKISKHLKFDIAISPKIYMSTMY